MVDHKLGTVYVHRIVSTILGFLTKHLIGVGAISVFAITLSYYIPLIPPDPTPADGSSFSLAAYQLGQPHLPYPIHSLLGYLFTKLPFGTIAERVTLLSSVAGAGIAVLLYLTVGRLVQHFQRTFRKSANAYLIGIIAAFFITFTPSFWSASVTAEVYGIEWANIDGCICFICSVGG